MKQLFITALLGCLITSAQAQYVDLPDGAFKSFLQTKYPGCFNVNGQLNTACTSITQEDSLVFHLGLFNPVDITGIQYFSSLQYLDVSGTMITSYPPLPSSLKYLDMSQTGTSPGDGYVPPLPAGLKHLDCSNNSLNSFPALPAGLTYLNFSNNSFNSVSSFPASLDTLICSGQVSYGPYTHILRSLPALPAALKYLDCSRNGLNALPALPTGLLYLDCSQQNININPEALSNTLGALPSLPASLKYLNCSNNKLAALPALPAALVTLDCSRQYVYLNSFPPLPDPYDYTLGTLPTLPYSLQQLYCTSNKLQCLPRLPVTLSTLEYDLDKIACLPNTCTATPNAPVCNVANNPYQCAAYPLIRGIVFTDVNSNGIKDAGEPGKKNIKVKFTNGNGYTFTDINGNFVLAADSTGTYTVTAEAPPYFSTAPVSLSFTFNRYDTAVTANFGLRVSAVHDSVNIHITPMSNFARPGSTLVYRIGYENAGTRSLPAAIVLDYDDTRLMYDSSSNAAVTNAVARLNLATGNLAPGQNSFFDAYFKVKTTVAIRDSIKISAGISNSGASGNDSNTITVRAAYDPNDKQATAQLSPAQVTSGQYIDYIIRFQNTGTAAAENIAVTDKISSLLQVNSIQLVAASHACTMSVTNNQLLFEFKNINLPDSNSNEIKSHGFVQFRIKPIATASLNTVISNEANIYFDYNDPVLTNTAYTAIKEPGRIYMFTGNGNWNNSVNWKNGVIAPSMIPQSDMVIISPAGNGSCLLNVPVSFLPGATLIVQENKNFVVQGNLTMQ